MSLTEHDHMVKSIPVDQTNKPISVLPWRQCRDRPIPNAKRPKTSSQGIDIDAIPIANNILGQLHSTVGLSKLAGNPFRARCAVTLRHRSLRRVSSISISNRRRFLLYCESTPVQFSRAGNFFGELLNWIAMLGTINGHSLAWIKGQPR